MENKIALGSFAGILSQATGKSKKICEDFLREFFRLVSETLREGESLKIKGFGSFKIVEVESRSSINVNTGEPIEIAPYKKVVFTPAKEIASAINAPFEEFESVEMEDEMPEEMISEEEISDENNVSLPRLEEGSQEEGEDDDITYEAYKEIEKEETETPIAPIIEEPLTKQPEESQPEQPEESLSERPDEDNITSIEETKEDTGRIYNKSSHFKEYEPEINIYPPVYDKENKKSRFGIGFLIGALSTFVVCAVIFMLGCFFDWWPVNFGSPKNLVTQEEITLPQEPEPQEIVEEEPTPEPVYDTVSTTRYLTTIARDHYGNFNFWPYIYLENESKLDHPDHIKPGTSIVIPDIRKYGVDPSNPKDIEKARKLGVEIYNKINQ